MSPGGPAAWPALALLLLWLPGCAPLSCPSKVTGTVGGSLSVQCRYEEEYKDKPKSWCKKSFLCNDLVKTTDSKREVRSGRVSISDHPANLSLTVTMEHLTLEDAGSYECQVDTPWHDGFDPGFRVKVTVLPATLETPTSVPLPKTSTTIIKTPAAPSTSLATESDTPGSSSQGLHHGQGPGLPVLLSGLALLLLLLLLVGSSLLAWRRLQRRVEAGERSELSQHLRQAVEQSEPYYANLKLQTWSLQEEPAPPKQVEVEYSTVARASEALHYTSVVFDSEKQDSKANGVSPQRPREEEPEYSVIGKPRDSHLSPHPCPP
ncbi:CMRF35-like molecule 8 isoform X2 [Sciurus carolinensis]|uniref:CMRF35-like molecule 8 isoform X2 n=1 Tax=Sciurus carolinensis TaxID=30640 RepID=UPI001FB48EDB|nr:CMRF35-like molecule 8 isoform X2 [Sciurus carolinensis]